MLSSAAVSYTHLEELCARAVRAAQEKQLPRRIDFCAGDVHRAIHSISHLIEQKAELALSLIHI